MWALIKGQAQAFSHHYILRLRVYAIISVTIWINSKTQCSCRIDQRAFEVTVSESESECILAQMKFCINNLGNNSEEPLLGI